MIPDRSFGEVRPGRRWDAAVLLVMAFALFLLGALALCYRAWKG